MIVFNDRVITATFQFLANYGIIGLYVSVVLVVGRFLRLALQKLSMQIMFEVCVHTGVMAATKGSSQRVAELAPV